MEDIGWKFCADIEGDTSMNTILSVTTVEGVTVDVK
jgi:hypothetical protein